MPLFYSLLMTVLNAVFSVWVEGWLAFGEAGRKMLLQKVSQWGREREGLGALLGKDEAINIISG